MLEVMAQSDWLYPSCFFHFQKLLEPLMYYCTSLHDSIRKNKNRFFAYTLLPFTIQTISFLEQSSFYCVWMDKRYEIWQFLCICPRTKTFFLPRVLIECVFTNNYTHFKAFYFCSLYIWGKWKSSSCMHAWT